MATEPILPPFVRVVVLNFDGGPMTLDCIDALTHTDWPADRFEIVSFGEDRPLAQGSNEEAWSRNRRGQFVIIAGQNAINPPA